MSDAGDPAVKVVYILGMQRGGTTIAGRLMGELPGWAFVGELRKLWEVALPERRRCGCGKAHEECEVWSPVLSRVMRDRTPAQVKAWQDETVPGRRVFSTRLWRARRAPGAAPEAVRSFLQISGDTYQALAEANGARVLVDGSKRPAEGHLLTVLPNVEHYFVHIVRDPRGTTLSALSRSDRPAGLGSRLPETLSRASGWVVRHLGSAALRARAGRLRSLELTYEELVADPNGCLERIARLLGEPPPPTPVVVDGLVDLGVSHTPSGAGRFTPRRVKLERDDRWVTQLCRADFLAITAVTAPLLLRYRYPFRRPAR